MQHSAKKVTLNNGATGLLIDVPSATVTSFDIAFRAGDFLSPKGKTDTAHIMEHLALGANKKFPNAKDYHKEFSKYGAYSNAYTGDYHMGYDAECGADESERILDLLCVAIESPLMTQEDFESEVGNVREELKMRRNNDDVELSLELENELGFVPIGFTDRIAELDSIELEDILNHYKKTHTTSNMIFMISGPINNIEDHIISRLEAIDLPKGTGLIELPTEKPKNLSEVFTAENQNLDNICYRWEQVLPKFDTYLRRDSMNALFDILFNGFHSRVFGELRERGLVYGIFGSHYETKDNAVGVISGQVQLGNAEEAFSILRKELEDIAKNGVSEQELKDLRRRAFGEVQRHSQTVMQVSNWYRHLFSLRGEVEDYYGLQDRLKQVSSDSVKSIAQEILNSPIQGFGIMYNPKEALDVGALSESLLGKRLS